MHALVRKIPSLLASASSGVVFLLDGGTLTHIHPSIQATYGFLPVITWKVLPL